MQIKVDALDMLQVLTDFGISDVESKAIILDLLLKSESGPVVKKIAVDSPETDQSKGAVVIDESPAAVTDAAEHLEMSVVEKSDDLVEHEIVPKKKLKRINFAAFGGVADPLRQT